MYGLLLEAISTSIKSSYGEDKWEEIRRAAQVEVSFSIHQVYDEDLISKIAEAASVVLGQSTDAIMYDLGVAFVSFVGQYGYDNILQVLGRHMRDFLNGLDNLHEYLRFSYPELKAPSFFVENESKSGLTLHYRSRRQGYKHYVMGQIRRVGELFYDTKVAIHVVHQEAMGDDGLTSVTYRLLFNNSAFRTAAGATTDSVIDNIPLRSEVLFSLFPFHLVFGRDMIIRSLGTAFAAVIGSAVDRSMKDVFDLVRPLIGFSWREVRCEVDDYEMENSAVSVDEYDGERYIVDGYSTKNPPVPVKDYDDVLGHNNNVFVLRTVQEIIGKPKEEPKPQPANKGKKNDSDYLHVKGQMLEMAEWDCIMFVGTPILTSLDHMLQKGLFINDLSMHDSSRDLVLAGTQQSAELKLALDQEQGKSRLLEESMKKLDEEIKRTDALLYQMIPKPVAVRLRRGEPSVSTCETFECVTILFSDVVGFTTICSRISPMEVVSMLNAMYTMFDQLSELHDVYKVETIGDAYMAVSGAPTVTKIHASNMCHMALDMLKAMDSLTDPSSGQNMKIRVGIHSGTTVAGVVGIKMPRYCLFGDTVNTASRMETNGEAMKIHISETTRALLKDDFIVRERGQTYVKGKGSMKTYWLLGRNEADTKPPPPKCPFTQVLEKEIQRRASLDPQAAQTHPEMGPGQPGDTPLGHRSIYSPVSFDDINSTDGALSTKPSPLSTPHLSPSHASRPGSVAEVVPDSRGCVGQKRREGSRHGQDSHRSLAQSPSPPQPPQPQAQQRQPHHQPHGDTARKPTQAVPPTRSGSSSPSIPNAASASQGPDSAAPPSNQPPASSSSSSSALQRQQQQPSVGVADLKQRGNENPPRVVTPHINNMHRPHQQNHHGCQGNGLQQNQPQRDSVGGVGSGFSTSGDGGGGGGGNLNQHNSVNVNVNSNANSSSSGSGSTGVNNNGKAARARAAYPISTSDVQEPCSPVKLISNDLAKRSAGTGSGGGDVGGGSVGGGSRGGGKRGGAKVSSSSGGSVKRPPSQGQGQGQGVLDVSVKDSRTEKPKSKTCSLL